MRKLSADPLGDPASIVRGTKDNPATATNGTTVLHIRHRNRYAMRLARMCRWLNRKVLLWRRGTGEVNNHAFVGVAFLVEPKPRGGPELQPIKHALAHRSGHNGRGAIENTQEILATVYLLAWRGKHLPNAAPDGHYEIRFGKSGVAHNLFPFILFKPREPCLD